MKRYKLDYSSPIGIIEVEGSDTAIDTINFAERAQVVNAPQQDTPEVLLECVKQLHEYFLGDRQEFSFPYVFEVQIFNKLFGMFYRV